MSRLGHAFLLFLILSPAANSLVLGQPSAATPTNPALDRLEREFMRFSKQCGGTLGVGAVHLESGRQAFFNGRERFPMASSYKIPIAVQLLTRVEQGHLSLDRMVELRLKDLHPGSGTLTPLFSKPGVSLSVRNLLELMLLISDNSATDILLRLSGGPEAVTSRLRGLGIKEMDISRPTVQLIADWAGYSLPPEDEWTPELFTKLYEGTTSESRKVSADRFDGDSRDTSTPEAMVQLLQLVYAGSWGKPATRDLLMDILTRCQTGEARLKGFLPLEVPVAHKTGTIGGTANDVGIITLPDGGGHVAVAAFVKSSNKPVPERERAIAHVSRSVYDYFLFQTAEPDSRR
ncbi:MAG: class A beta-lactamase [Acidobacteriota bacterium]